MNEHWFLSEMGYLWLVLFVVLRLWPFGLFHLNQIYGNLFWLSTCEKDCGETLIFFRGGGRGDSNGVAEQNPTTRTPVPLGI